MCLVTVSQPINAGNQVIRIWEKTRDATDWICRLGHFVRDR